MKKILLLPILFVAIKTLGQAGAVPIKAGDGNTGRPAAIVKPQIKSGGGEAFQKAAAIQKAPLQSASAGGTNFKQVAVQKPPLSTGGGGGGSVQNPVTPGLQTGVGAQPNGVQAAAAQPGAVQGKAAQVAGAQPATGQATGAQAGKNVVTLPSSVPVKQAQNSPGQVDQKQ